MRLSETARATAALAVVSTAVVAVVGFGPAGVPAHADEAPSLTVTLSNEIHIGAFGSPGKRVLAWVTGSHVQHPTVTFDVSLLTTAATAEFPATCTAKGAVHTCAVSGGDDIAQPIAITLHAVKDPQPGLVPAQLSYTASADNVAPHGAASIVVLEDGVDLAVTTPDDRTGTAKPGDHVRIPVQFRNVGNHTARGFQVQFFANRGLVLENLDNCAFVDKWPFQVFQCTLDGPSDVLGPGQTSNRMDIDATVTAEAMGLQTADYVVAALGDDDSVPPHIFDLQRRPSGKGLHLSGATASVQATPPTDIDATDNGSGLGWTVANTVDVAAVGSTGGGQAGDVVKLRVGLHDNGPAFLDSTHSGKGVRSYEVTLPPGTEPVLVPGNCQAIARRPAPAAYRCETDQLFIPAHEESTVIFRVRITRVIAGASGSVTIVDQPADLDPGNDTAQVLVNPTGNGLPITGAQTAVIAAVGALLLVAGATLYLLARVLARVTSARRRTSAARR